MHQWIQKLDHFFALVFPYVQFQIEIDKRNSNILFDITVFLLLLCRAKVSHLTPIQEA